MMSPKYSRSYIDRIGTILVDDNRSEAEKDSALVTLNEWRALHLYPMNTFQATLRKYVGAVDADGIVVQRLKRTPTIVDKLKNRHTSMSLGRMQDVGGLRAIVNTVQSVCKIKKKFTNSRAKHTLKRLYDYIDEPRDSGYCGVHLVFEYHNSNRIDCDGLFIEIQLRTRLQHLWSTAVETVGFFFSGVAEVESGQ
jgi:ppGpp synthetase/RelA/SpoT-type nucleotidyltranferase